MRGISAAPWPRRTAGRAHRAFSTFFFFLQRGTGQRSHSPWGPGRSPHEPTWLLRRGAHSGSGCARGPWNGGGGPPQHSRAQRGSGSCRWRTGSSPTQPHVQGPRLPLPGCSAPTTLTQIAKAPPGGGDPQLPCWPEQGGPRGGGCGQGTSKGRLRGPGSPFLLGPRARHRLGPAPAQRRQDPCFLPTDSASEQTSSTEALRTSGEPSGSSGRPHAPRSRVGGGPLPTPRPPPPGPVQPPGLTADSGQGGPAGTSGPPQARKSARTVDLPRVPWPEGNRQGAGRREGALQLLLGLGGGSWDPAGRERRGRAPCGLRPSSSSLESALTSSFCIKRLPFKADPVVDSLTGDKPA